MVDFAIEATSSILLFVLYHEFDRHIVILRLLQLAHIKA